MPNVRTNIYDINNTTIIQSYSTRIPLQACLYSWEMLGITMTVTPLPSLAYKGDYGTCFLHLSSEGQKTQT